MTHQLTIRVVVLSLFQNGKMRLKSVFTVLLFNISLSISEDYYDLLGG